MADIKNQDKQVHEENRLIEDLPYAKKQRIYSINDLVEDWIKEIIGQSQHKFLNPFKEGFRDQFLNELNNLKCFEAGRRGGASGGDINAVSRSLMLGDSSARIHIISVVKYDEF